MSRMSLRVSRAFFYASLLAWGALVDSSVSAQEFCPTTAERVTNIYFANGVNTTEADARISATRMSDAWVARLRDAYPGEDFCVLTAYNYSANLARDIQEVFRQRLQSAGFDVNAVAAYYLLNMFDAGADESDLRESQAALGYTWSENFLLSASNEYTDSLAQILERQVQTQNEFTRRFEGDLLSGRRALIIAHSQGNLFANSSVSEVIDRNRDSAESIAIVGVASPAAETVFGFPYVTAKDDRVINTLRRISSRPVLASYFDNDERIGPDFFGGRSPLNHFFIPDYFHADLPSRAWIDDQVLDVLLPTMPFPVPGGVLGPSAVTLLANAGSEPRSIRLDWEVALGGVDPIEYLVYDDTDPGVRVLLERTAATSYVVSMLGETTERCFVIVTADGAGETSEDSNRSCSVPSSRPDATEGWLVFDTGDPGVPGDGLVAPGVACPSIRCGSRSFTPTERIRLAPGSAPITISIFEARFGFILKFRLDGFPSYCSASYGNLPDAAPPYNGVPGRFLVVNEQIFNDAVNRARQASDDCGSAPVEAGYISGMDVSTGGLGMDAAYLAYGIEVFPEDGRPPIAQTPGWVSFVEGAAGVPNDGVLVAGQPQHTIVEQLAVDGANGLTLSVYGLGDEVLDEVTIRYRGFPEACNYSFPLGIPLPSAPSIQGVTGKFFQLSRSQLGVPTQTVTILNAQQCTGVSIDDVYFSEFIVSGAARLVDGVFIGRGVNVFPAGDP